MTDKIRTIAAVRAEGPGTIFITWSDGTAAKLNLGRVFGKATPDAETFSNPRIKTWGHGIDWEDGTELGAERLWLETLSATGHGDAREFLEWRLRHGLSLAGAGTALGISRRMVAYYSNGEKPVPRAILLACKGWEVLAAA